MYNEIVEIFKLKSCSMVNFWISTTKCVFFGTDRIADRTYKKKVLGSDCCFK